MKGDNPMREHHRLALATYLTAACLLFLPASTAFARGAEVTDLTEKSGIIENHDTLIGKIPHR